MDSSQLLQLEGLQTRTESQSYNDGTDLHTGNDHQQSLQHNHVAVERIISAVYGDPQTDVHDPEQTSDEEEAPKPKYGKKTRGRVKIKMQFINNKLRRYTTFSKRKTGIMKKAYELSTLTGTQVMLLVASETGHVYTFATKKLQPMITSESGKALIQTCLNSPENTIITQHDLENDRRMNPNGFEETELCYAVADDDEEGEVNREVHETMLNGGNGSESEHKEIHSSSSIMPSSSTNSLIGNTFNINTIIPPTSNSDGTMGKVTNLTMQVPHSLPLQSSVSVQQSQQQQHSQQQHHVIFSTGSNGESGQLSEQLSGQHQQMVSDFETVTHRQLQRQQEEQRQEIDRLTQLNQEQLQIHNQLQIQHLQMPQSHIMQQLTNQNMSQLSSPQQIMIPKSALLSVGGGSTVSQGNNTVLYQTPQNQTLVYTAAGPSIPNMPEGVALVNIVTSQANNFSSSQMGTISSPAQQQFITIPISQFANNSVLQQVIGGQDLGKKT